MQGFAAGLIYYYLFPDKSALNSGFLGFLDAENFTINLYCSKNSDRFTNFIAQCESSLTNTTQPLTGSVAEYLNIVNHPIIVSTDDQQLLMAVMAGTNDGGLLSYWKQFNWIAPVLRSKSVADVQAYARALEAEEQGWGATQFACLKQLWNRESGWHWDAQNPSGASGIPQTLPGSKMAIAGADWATNPATQIKWGLGYIKEKHGTPCRAWRLSRPIALKLPGVPPGGNALGVGLIWLRATSRPLACRCGPLLAMLSRPEYARTCPGHL